MLVIGLVGKAGAGKGTVAAHLTARYRGSEYRFSRVLDEILHRIKKENTRDNQIALALALRKAFGNGILAYVLQKDIEREQPTLAVVDGIRYPEEHESFSSIKTFKLVGVTARSSLRYRRTRERGEKAHETTLSQEAFLALEARETEAHLEELMKRTDATIDNNGTLADLTQQVDTLIAQWNFL
jgi:dephospho-CoA kinase